MDVKLAAEDRKLKAKEHRLTLEKERIRDGRKEEDRAIMFMNPTTMDETTGNY